MNVGCSELSVLGLPLAVCVAAVSHGWWDRHTGCGCDWCVYANLVVSQLVVVDGRVWEAENVGSGE